MALNAPASVKYEEMSTRAPIPIVWCNDEANYKYLNMHVEVGNLRDVLALDFSSSYPRRHGMDSIDLLLAVADCNTGFFDAPCATLSL